MNRGPPLGRDESVSNSPYAHQGPRPNVGQHDLAAAGGEHAGEQPLVGAAPWLLDVSSRGAPRSSAR